MSDVEQPRPDEMSSRVRAAAEALKRAIDAHLQVVETRTGPADERVADAYEALAAAADAYDEVLYEAYDEVTPFELPTVDEEGSGYPDTEDPEAVSVLIRRDYLVVDPARLRRQAARVESGVGPAPEPATGAAGALAVTDTGADAEADADADAADTVTPILARPRSGPRTGIELPGTNSALGLLFGEYEPDEIASRCEEFGLEEGDSTLWVCATEPAEPGEWLAEPFEDVDAQTMICRFDVSEIYGDELEALDPDR
ncbi:hypothetical protein [Phaeacidiphilus oryzae]|uniref:hypothetical protein n=1 Tax=Phaeacidiphilus oryzae TaxID=348818 RepID=UPI00055DF9E4|nr:hypothetical protein [Phaeacidiphilus oryzae]